VVIQDGPVWVHAEMMDRDHLWIGVTLSDGQRVRFAITTRRRAVLDMRAEIE
jgi:cold shock CspA family protein